MKKKLAFLISRVFDLHIIGTLTIILAVTQGVFDQTRLRFLFIVTFFDVFLPFIFFLFLYRTGRVSDWWVTKRQERLPIFIFVALTHFLGILSAGWYGNLEVMRLLMSFYTLFLVFLVTMLFYKISTHTGILSTLVFLLAAFFGSWYLLLYGLVILVAWSRVVLKAHSLGQVFWGAVIPPVIMSLAFRFWGKPGF